MQIKRYSHHYKGVIPKINHEMLLKKLPGSYSSFSGCAVVYEPQPDLSFIFQYDNTVWITWKTMKSNPLSCIEIRQLFINLTRMPVNISYHASMVVNDVNEYLSRTGQKYSNLEYKPNARIRFNKMNVRL